MGNSTTRRHDLEASVASPQTSKPAPVAVESEDLPRMPGGQTPGAASCGCGFEEGEERLEDQARQRIQRLERALAAAESVNRAKSELLARLSHELRTPLTGVVGYADLLLSQPLDDKLRQLVHGIVAAGDALLAIADEIKDFSCFEDRETALEPEAIDPRQLVAGVLELFTPRTRIKNLSLELEIGHQVPARIILDAERLRQVLIHLVANAIKATVAGGVSIKVDVGRSEGEPRLRIVVQDTGTGIPAEAIPTLFEPFTRDQVPSTGGERSNGLGLVLSRRKVEEMAGTLGVESTLGVGSTFNCEVPFAISGEPSSAAARDLGEPLAPVVVGAPGRILLVEDNDLNRNYVMQQLELLGHRAAVVVNGYEALALLEAERFDLVLMDCQMPGIDGYETARRLRRREQGDRHTPIVAVTADAMSGGRQRCLDAGMDDYLTKPFHLRDLEEVLDKWLGTPCLANLAQSDGHPALESN